MKKIALVPVVLATVLAVTGCAPVETAAEVKESGSAAKVTKKDKKDVENASAEEESPATAKIGDTVVVADWEVKVTGVAMNANAILAQANMFNDKPKGQYVLVNYTATYTGDQRMSDATMDLSWSFTDTANNVHDQAYQVTPADNQTWPTEARKGGTIKQQVLFDLKPNAIKGGILTVEAMDANFDTVYADFIV